MLGKEIILNGTVWYLVSQKIIFVLENATGTGTTWNIYSSNELQTVWFLCLLRKHILVFLCLSKTNWSTRVCLLHLHWDVFSLHRMNHWTTVCNKIIFHLVESGLIYVQVTQDGKRKLCAGVQNYHQLHLSLHILPKGNCQSQTTESAEVWRRRHLNGNYLPLLFWQVHNTSWFYKETILQ